MKNIFQSTSKLLVATTLVLGLSASSLMGEVKHTFKIAWSIYVGYMPWDYAEEQGIVDKWAKKYGIKIKLVQVNSYMGSITQYTAGKFDGVCMTNMDALTIPAADGIDTTALIMIDFSNGNDGIILKGKNKLADIKGQRVDLVEFSVSHYLLARALESIGLSERDVKVVNTSDADMIAAYSSNDVSAVVTWNPQLNQIKKEKGAHLVFNSSEIPGEIIDILGVNTKTLKDNPALGKALTGAWFEMMGLVKKDNKKVLTFMANASGTNLTSFKSQLKTTHFFYTPSEALKFVDSSTLPQTMKKVSEFSFNHGLLGEGAPNAKYIGVEFPNGKIFGDSKNIKLRFTDTYIKMAEDGKL